MKKPYISKLKQHREAAGLSQSQFAEIAQISVRTLQEYERGSRDINGAAVMTVWKLAKALNCEIVDLLNWGDSDGR